MYNNTNTDVKVPVQKYDYHLNLEIVENKQRKHAHL